MQYGKDIQLKKKRKWNPEKERQQQILQSLHHDAAGGCHLGRDKTRDKVSRRYFWHNQCDDVDQYSETCQKVYMYMQFYVC